MAIIIRRTFAGVLILTSLIACSCWLRICNPFFTFFDPPSYSNDVRHLSTNFFGDIPEPSYTITRAHFGASLFIRMQRLPDQNADWRIGELGNNELWYTEGAGCFGRFCVIHLRLEYWLLALVFGAFPAVQSIKLYRRRLLSADIAYPCSRCKYDLTGNRSGTCPECGALISALVTASEKVPAGTARK